MYNIKSLADRYEKEFQLKYGVYFEQADHKLYFIHFELWDNFG